MRILEQPYLTPEGKQDTPFCYVFDASGITNGLAQLQNLSVQLQGDSEFVLRHIAGVNLCVAAGSTGRFNFRNASGSYANGNPSTGVIFPPNFPVVPEKLYPQAGGAILFDLYNTSKHVVDACSGNPVSDAQIAFFGVKRFGYQAGYPTQKTPYRFRPCKYTYGYDLTLNWNHFALSTNVAPPRRFTVELDRYDFELLRISITKTTAGSQGTGALATNDFQIMLYDSNQHQLFSSAVNQSFINSGRPTPATAPAYQPALAPSLVYPVGSAITFDISSMGCNLVNVPQTYNIAFEGIWRTPC